MADADAKPISETPAVPDEKKAGEALLTEAQVETMLKKLMEPTEKRVATLEKENHKLREAVKLAELEPEEREILLGKTDLVERERQLVAREYGVPLHALRSDYTHDAMVERAKEVKPELAPGDAVKKAAADVRAEDQPKGAASERLTPVPTGAGLPRPVTLEALIGKDLRGMTPKQLEEHKNQLVGLVRPLLR